MDWLRHPLCTLERWAARAGLRRPGPPTAEALARHAAADARGDETYADPVTGRLVFTATALRRLGACCGNACRHCPYPAAAR